MATRADAIANARQHLHSGEFIDELNRRVGFQTQSQAPLPGDPLRAYLVEGLQPAFEELGFSTRVIESPIGKGPYLLADYREDPSLLTVLSYGHGDVVGGMVGEWRDNLNTWQTTTRDSTASIWQHCVPSAKRAAASSASMPSSSSRPARKSAHRIWRRSASRC